jgi:protein-L-isoaspartate(D-aspartate) O-methyltransferase
MQGRRAFLPTWDRLLACHAQPKRRAHRAPNSPGKTLILLLVLLSLFSGRTYGQAAPDAFSAARHHLVETEIVAAGIQDPRVIESMRNTPRHEFVPRNKLALAYYDMAIPIGHQQTISPPFVVAYMTEQLDPQPSDKVLEIGTGSGYQAAVLSPLVRDVYTIEIVEPLGRRAAATLERLGYENVHTRIGDGFQGWPEEAPFDKIIVTCSPEDIPQPLVEQLAEGGRIVVPLGERFNQTLYLFTKTEGKLEREVLQATFFVPMTGLAEQLREIKPEAPLTELVNGSFEETINDADQLASGAGRPLGWYYVRQGRIESGNEARDGKHFITFTNTTPGRNAHGMQAFGVDGRKVDAIDVSFWVRGEDLDRGPTPQQAPQVLIEFYDSLRAPVGHARIGPWIGSFDWRPEVEQVKVPPAARLAVMGIGLFGATGAASFDAVKLSLPSRP